MLKNSLAELRSLIFDGAMLKLYSIAFHTRFLFNLLEYP